MESKGNEFPPWTCSECERLPANSAFNKFAKRLENPLHPTTASRYLSRSGWIANQKQIQRNRAKAAKKQTKTSQDSIANEDKPLLAQLENMIGNLRQQGLGIAFKFKTVDLGLGAWGPCSHSTAQVAPGRPFGAQHPAVVAAPAKL